MCIDFFFLFSDWILLYARLSSQYEVWTCKKKKKEKIKA